MRLEARNIVFGYDRGTLVLDGVDFDVASGERVALVGPSGCGKSTLAGILAGNLRPKSGGVYLDGEPLPPRGFCPAQLIYQHPEKAINPRWKLRETLIEAWNPDDEFLSALGIEKEWLNRYPAELSGGEIQRFCVARALAPETKFIIADEISTMLDVITQSQIWGFLLRAVRERNMGLLAVTHNAALAGKVCDRAVSFGQIGHSENGR